MAKKTYIKVLLFLLISGFMIAGCSNEMSPDEAARKEGMVPFEVKLAKGYSSIPTRANPHGRLTDGMIHDLPDRSTLRLILQPKSSSTDATKQFVYIVESDKFGNSYLSPCEVDDEGRLIEGSIRENPYHLPINTSYKCMAISPAKKVDEDLKIAVYNQEELLATNDHWTQTASTTIAIGNNVSEKYNVQLNPLMYTTAKIRITVVNGKSITDLTGGDPVVELDRVPTNPGGRWIGDYDDNNKDVPHTAPTKNLEIGDTIEAQMGNNILYNRMYVTEWDTTCVYNFKGYETIKNEKGENEEIAIWDKDITLTTETNILPMDARPTPMIIRLNLNINLTPMQFQYQTNKKFQAGHVYDYTATINLKEDGIYIATWQDNEWSTELDPITETKE